MEILVLGACAEVGKKVFSKQGHSVKACCGLLWKVQKAVRESRPELVFAVENLQQSVINWLREKGITLWGDSEWSKALLLDTYQRKILEQLKVLGMSVSESPYSFTLEGWWNGTNFHFSWWYHSRDRMLNDDVGPALEGAWLCGMALRQSSLLRRKYLEVLAPFLIRTRHVGPVRLRLSLQARELSVLDIQCKSHMVSLAALGELFQDPAQLFGMGKPRYAYDMKVGALRARLLPGTEASTEALQPDNPGALKHIVKIESAQSLAVTSRGIDTTELRRRIYRTVQELSSQDVVYRTDLGRGFRELEKELVSLRLL